MKKYWLLGFLLGLAIGSTAQVTDTLFFNSYWEVMDPYPREFISYYRVAEIDTSSLQFVGKTEDYHINGQPKTILHYDSYGRKQGPIVSYFDNGKIALKGQYMQDKPTGIWQFYDSTGWLRDKINMTEVAFTVIESNYNKDGKPTVQNGTGTWKHTLVALNGITYYIKGDMKDGQRDGVWLAKNKNGGVILKEVYKNGQLTKGMILNYENSGQKYFYKDTRISRDLLEPLYLLDLKNPKELKIGLCSRKNYPYLQGCKLDLPGSTYSDNGDATIYEVVTDPAHYAGGIRYFYDCVKDNMRYPKQAMRMGLEGRVFVQFVVEKNGEISNLEVMRGIGAGCDEEALRVVQQCGGKFIPAKVKGQPVRQRLVLPITFRLN